MTKRKVSYQLVLQESSLSDVASEMEEFLDKKKSVKELVDSGIEKVPAMFVYPSDGIPTASSTSLGGIDLQVPVIDLKGYQSDRRAEIVDAISNASEKWGIFYIVNHGIPSSVIEKLLDSVKKFNEQPKEAKMEFYSYEFKNKMYYYTLESLLGSRPAGWKDKLVCEFEDGLMDHVAIPELCRDAILEYISWVLKLKEVLYGLVSEALGLKSDYLASIECFESLRWVGNYYPPCPQPELAIGSSRHIDPYFLTVLVQDNIGALQVLHENHWVTVPPLEGALIVNMGIFMQLISNDKFKGVEHTVVATGVGPRLSSVVFFRPSKNYKNKPYGPIKELLSPNNPPHYKETGVLDFLACLAKRGADVNSILTDFRI